MEGVRVTALNKTSVSVSWNTLIILDVPILNYTVVYGPASGRQDERMSIVFPPSAMFGVIGGLRPGTTYQFQMYATVEVNATTLIGDPSPVTDDSMIRLKGDNMESQKIIIDTLLTQTDCSSWLYSYKITKNDAIYIPA